MKSPARLILPALFITVLASACAKEEPPMVMTQPGLSYATSAPAHADALSQKLEEEDLTVGADERSQQRMVIRTASITLEVKDPEAALGMVGQMASAKEGFIVTSSTHAYSADTKSASLQLRVPATHFEQLLGELRGMGELQAENVQGQDVTAEFVDLRARLKTQRQLEARFLALLETSEDIDTTLKLEKELARVRGQIEQMQGREKYLKNQVSMSTIDVSLNPPAPTITGRAFGEEIGDAVNDGREGAVIVVGGLVRMTIALAPLILLASMLFGGVVWYMRRRKKRA